MARLARSDVVPFAVQDALVQVAGRAFWYKRPLVAVLHRSGVPRQLLDRYAEQSKYSLMREVLAELDARGSSGVRVQHQIVRELSSLRAFGDEVDKEVAREAVQTLRAVAEEHGMLAPPKSAVDAVVTAHEARKRRKQHRARLQDVKDRTATLADLHRRYCDLLAQTEGQQRRGLSLEPLLGDLMRLEGLDYHPPYRKHNVSQTDGFFRFDSFSYLIEARWRKEPPDVAALSGFASKVQRSLQSTRGLFVSIVGFRQEAVEELAMAHRNVIMMSGAELAIILEGQMSFRSLLIRKLDHAARTGELCLDLAQP
jgi:hypothetical protein